MKAKKIILWTAAGILILVLVAVVSLVLLVQHSQSFRGYLLHRVEQGLDESTGARLTARDFKVSFGGLQLDLYGIVIHGTDGATTEFRLTGIEDNVPVPDKFFRFSPPPGVATISDEQTSQ